MPVGLVVATLLFFGCSDETEPVPDAGTPDSGVMDAGASADVSVDTLGPDAPGDGFINLFDIIPLPDAGCIGCISNRCGAQINACFNNPTCAAGLLCTLQMCAAGFDGGLNPSSFPCVLGCFNGDINTALMAIGSLTCLTMTCAPECNFGDAGSDVRIPMPDAPMPPDVSSDAMPDTDEPDAGVPEGGSEPDAGVPEGGSEPDAGEQDADSAPPGNDAADDTAPDTEDAPDIAPPEDVAADTTPTEDGGAD